MGLFDNDLISKNILEDYNHPKTKNELQRSIEYYVELINPKEGDIVDLNWIDTSKIDDMSWLFQTEMYFSNTKKFKTYNYNVSKWDVSNVKNMTGIFYKLRHFNCDLSKWDVSNVENMNYMFYACYNFNCDISKWDVSNVKDMREMFRGCKNFNQDLSKWDVSKVTNMSGMFYNCPKMKEKNKPHFKI